jgi:hypothetical protein
VSTIVNDLARIKISTNDSPVPSNTEPPTNNSDALSDVDTPINQAKSEKQCTNCGNHNAKAYCAGCHQAPNTDGTPHVNVRYCTKECQKAHWPAHRLECKNLQARKALFRAARLLQKMWYTVRRESFDNCIVKAEEVNGELWIHEGDYDLEPTKRNPGFYRDFPDAIFKNKQDADTCLNLLYCTDSLGHMYMVNHWLLKGRSCWKTVLTTIELTVLYNRHLRGRQGDQSQSQQAHSQISLRRQHVGPGLPP